MNKKILTIALACIFPFTIAAAQKNDGSQGWHHGDRIEHLTKELDLTADQKTKLEAIFNQQRETFKAAHEANHKLIEGILTKEQTAKWDELKKHRHEKWQKCNGGQTNTKSTS
jgi:Spy/CpxP family protein refolding chaperone